MRCMQFVFLVQEQRQLTEWQHFFTFILLHISLFCFHKTYLQNTSDHLSISPIWKWHEKTLSISLIFTRSTTYLHKHQIMVVNSFPSFYLKSVIEVMTSTFAFLTKLILIHESQLTCKKLRDFQITIATALMLKSVNEETICKFQQQSTQFVDSNRSPQYNVRS